MYVIGREVGAMQSGIGRYFVYIGNRHRNIAMFFIVIIVGLLLGGVQLAFVPYLREVFAGNCICQYGGFVEWGYSGPQFIPEGMQSSIRVYNRIQRAQLTGPNVSKEALQELAQLESIRAISVQDTQASDAWLDGIRSKTLAGLHIGRTNVTDEGMRHLGRLSVLRSLNVSDNKAITDTGIQHLMRVQSLRSLSLEGVGTTDCCCDGICSLAELVALNLNRTQSGDRCAGEIAKLQKLEVLGMSHTCVTDRGVIALASLARLRELRLNHTHVTDASLRSLRCLVLLTRLELSGTDTTPQGRAELRTELPECRIMPVP